jgi:rRNA maturation protein Nop10
MKSDRISMEMVLVVAGSDLMGKMFVADGKTILIGRQGANIVVSHMLAPHAEINVRCVETGKEADARVAGQLGQAEGTYTYSVEFLDPASNPWGIEFPPAAESDEAVGRVVLECGACHIRELIYLNESELEVLETSNSLARYCKRCVDYTVWKKSTAPGSVIESPAPAPAPAPAKAPVRTGNERRENRREIRVATCVRSLDFGDDVVKSRNASRGGLCFESNRQYSKGWKIEVAIPFTRGSANIFLSGQIARIQPTQDASLTVYGVAYAK